VDKSGIIDGKIAFIGSGAMAEAMIKGLLERGLTTPGNIAGSEPFASRRAYMEKTYGIGTTGDNREAAAAAPILILSVKPQVLPEVLQDLHGRLDPETLVISIVAGARIQTLADGLAHRRIVRSIPNTPAQVGKGMTVWTATPEVSEENRSQAQLILSALGDALHVRNEEYIDMATGLSGSGPGFVFLFIEALIDAGVHIGLSWADARRMVLQTIEGSVEILRRSEAHPAALRNQVTSPAGTTSAGLLELEKGRLRATVIQAVTAATRRSQELGAQSETERPSSTQGKA
jgi:pyrroline-5-carboxylate reductase